MGSACSSSSGAWRASSAVRNLDEDGPQRARIPPSSSSTTSRCPRRTCSASRTAASITLMHGLAEERLLAAVANTSPTAEAAFDDDDGAYIKRTGSRSVQPVAAFQNTRFKLADMRTGDRCRTGVRRPSACLQHNEGNLSAGRCGQGEALFASELEARVSRRMPAQLHGGAWLHGRVPDQPHVYTAARVSRIYAGTSGDHARDNRALARPRSPQKEQGRVGASQPLSVSASWATPWRAYLANRTDTRCSRLQPHNRREGREAWCDDNLSGAKALPVRLAAAASRRRHRLRLRRQRRRRS